MSRIAFVAYRGNMRSGGQGVYLHGLTRELVRLGWQVDVFVGPPYPDSMPWARVVRLENHMFWGARFDRRPGAFLPRPNPWRIFTPLNFFEYCVTRFGFLPEPLAFSLRASSAVRRAQRAGARYDLVHDVQSVGYGLLWLRALGLPVVTTIHHPLTVDRRSSLARDRSFAERVGTLTFYPVRTQRRTARRLDAVLTSSEASAREIERGFAVPRARIRQVGNGVTLPPQSAARRPPEPPELLFVGRCGDPNKGAEFLFSALARLPERIRLRVLDGDPSGTPLGDLLLRLGVRTRVLFSGKVSQPELERAYQRASIVVVPSLFEGFGLPAIEALAAGTPVVASAAGALPEVIGLAGTGRLVPPGDVAALTRGILETLASWEDEQRLARAARPRLERQFGWPAVARRTAEVYAQVRKNRRAANLRREASPRAR